MIDGLIITPLKKIPSEQGSVFHMIRNDDAIFNKFGEVYFSSIYPNMIKGWHIHKKSFSHYAVPIGMVKLVVYDPRKKSPTFGEVQEIYLGEDNYILVTIPKQVWSSFKCIGDRTSLLAHLSTLPYDSTNALKLDINTDLIPYAWK